MRHSNRRRLIVGAVMVGFLGFMPSAFATKIVRPPMQSAWVIEKANYTGQIEGKIARMQVHYTIQVLSNGWVEIPLTLEGARITAIDIEKKTGEAHIIPRGETYVLSANKKGVYKVRVSFSNLINQDNEFEGIQFGIPRATFSTLKLHIPQQDVQLRVQDELYVEREVQANRNGVKLIARLGAANQVELKWKTKPAVPVKVEPIIYGEVNTFLTVEEQLAHLLTIIDYKITQGSAKQFAVQFPLQISVLNVRGAGIEDWEVAKTDSHQLLTVELRRPLSETSYRLIVDAEESLDIDVQEYAVPQIQLSGVKQERGYIAIARMGSIELSAADVKGINRIDVRELPAILQSAAQTPAVLGFRYHRHPYKVMVNVTRHEDHPVLSAIAERGELVTVLSHQGQRLTRATYLIKANKKQFLGIALPDGASLWSCLVNGKSVKPVEGKEGALMVPLDSGSDSTQSIPVELVYFQQGDELSRVQTLNLKGPILDVPTTIVDWSIYVPKSLKLLKTSGNLERGRADVHFIDEPLIRMAAQDRVQGNGMRFARMAGSLSNERMDYKTDDYYEQDRLGDKIFRILGGDSEKAKRALLAQNLPVAASAELQEKPSSYPREYRMEDVVASLNKNMKDAGILPLKIRLPKTGKVYHFNRLMTTQEGLELQATFVYLPTPWIPFAALGLLFVPMGGIVAYQIRRR